MRALKGRGPKQMFREREGREEWRRLILGVEVGGQSTL